MGCNAAASPSHGLVRKPANEFRKASSNRSVPGKSIQLRIRRACWQVYILDQNRKKRDPVVRTGRTIPRWVRSSSAIQPRASPCSRLVDESQLSMCRRFHDDVLTLNEIPLVEDNPQVPIQIGNNLNRSSGFRPMVYLHPCGRGRCHVRAKCCRDVAGPTFLEPFLNKHFTSCVYYIRP